ncbi:MAG TPA: glycosyltransferase family 4 protein [Steroidobacteraceae bacterium]|nr:glycosyltransferase family 4 protein [Steroidobacteraceae bacterium]
MAASDDQTPINRPRILEVLFSFRVGGSEVVGFELAKQLHESGAEVICASLDGIGGPLQSRCDEIGLPIVDLQISKKGLLARNGISLGLSKRLATLKVDVVHLQHFVALNKIGLPARMAGIPRIVVTEHSEAQLLESLAGRIRLRLNWRLAHRITVIHEGLRRYLIEQLHVPQDRIEVIANGIDLRVWQASDRQQCRTDLGLNSEFTFAFVGRLAEVKNVPGLITAFLAAASKLPMPVKLVIVGDGAEMERCRQLASEHSLGACVSLVGEHTDTRRFLAAADAFILNSHSEGVPRALLEAMAMGLPCIAPAVGGIPELLAGRGWLTSPNDVQSVILAISDVAQNQLAARSKAREGRQYVSNRFNSTDTLQRYQRALFSHLTETEY